MYGLYVISVVYVCYCVYSRYFKWDTVGFEDANEHSFEFIKMDTYSDGHVITGYTDELCTDNNAEYLIIDYEFNNKKMKFVTTDCDNYAFPMYSDTKIINRVFTRTMISAKINGEDCTEELGYYLGPNTNFYSDISECGIDLNKILSMDCNSGSIEIIDNIGSIETHELPWVPKWNPSVI